MFDDLVEIFESDQGAQDYVLYDLDAGNKKLRLSKSPLKEIQQNVPDQLGQVFQELSYTNSVNLTSGQSVNLNQAVPSSSKSQSIESDHESARKEGSESVLQTKKALEENLLAYLKGDGDGKIILKHFNDHKGFNPETRSLLTRTIIKKFKDDALKTLEVGQKLAKFTIETKVFVSLSQAIEKLFPGEFACTYFTPYKSEDGIAVQTSGTLWAHYNYLIEKLRSQNLLERRKSSKKDKNPVPLPQTDEIKVALNTLQNSLDPSTCLNDWRITHKHRQVLLLVDKLTISEYMDKFPCLKVQDAKQLIELDFDAIKPGKSNLLQLRWPTIKAILIKQFQTLSTDQKKQKKLSVDDLSYIKLLPTLESDHQDAVVLYLLQLLIGIGQPGKRKKGEPLEPLTKYRPSDIRESFIYQVEKTEDLDEEIKRLKSKVFQRKETLQPLMVMVGSLLKIEEAYVVVDEQQYKVASCLAALELTFKTFFALDCNYPKPSLRLWQFIQYAVYDIQIAGDTLIKSVKELLGLIRQAFPESAIQRPQEISLAIP